MIRLFSSTLLILCFCSLARAGEIGPNDFQISQVGADPTYDATAAAIAHNPDNDEYLLVWRADDDTIAGMVDNHFEVWGQRLSPILTPLGDRFRISTTGADNVANLAVNDPELVYNPTAGEYFVVWAGALTSGEMEIFGQRVDGSGGQLVGSNLRISSQGVTGNLNYEAFSPDIAYSSAQDQYMVVWSGDATTIPIFDDDFEIFAQRLSNTGSAVGSTLQISTTGPANDPDYPASRPAVAYDRTRDDYMVVWAVDVVDSGVQWEIYGQRINASDGVDVGTELWLSDASSSGNDLSPDVVYDHADQQYLVVWVSDEDATAGREIYGQRFDVPTGQQVGADDFRISFMGPDATSGFTAGDPKVNWCADQNRYLVSWSGVDDIAAGFEIYAQLLDAAALPLAPGPVRLSDMGTDAGPFEARAPAVAPGNGLVAVAWHGDDDSGELIDDEFEIHGQLLDPSTGSEVLTDVLLTRMGLTHGRQVYTGEIAYNPTANEYLVVWIGEKKLDPFHYGVFVRRVDATTGILVDSMALRVDEDTTSYPWSPSAVYNPTTNEYLVSWGDGLSRVWAQRLNASTLAEVGPNDILVSMPLPSSNASLSEPTLSYCDGVGRYVLVWAEDRLPGNEVELYMQQLDASGVTQFLDPLRITDFGTPGSSLYEPAEPAMAYDTAANALFVVWTGVAGGSSSRIHLLQFDLATNTPVGPVTQISQRSPQPEWFDREPSIAFNPATHEYLVAWWGDDDQGGTHVFLQRLDGNGNELGADDFELSEPSLFALTPDVAYCTTRNEYLVTWAESVSGQDDLAARRIGADGVPLGSGAFLLNDTGPPLAEVRGPRVAFGSTADNYLAAWDGYGPSLPFQMTGRDVRGQLYELDQPTAAPQPHESIVGPRIVTAFPNPFATRVQFQIEMDRTRDLQVGLYDVRGRRVLQVFRGKLAGPQMHGFTLSDRDLASGIYWLRVTGAGFTRSRRVTLLR